MKHSLPNPIEVSVGVLFGILVLRVSFKRYRV